MPPLREPAALPALDRPRAAGGGAGSPLAGRRGRPLPVRAGPEAGIGAMDVASEDRPALARRAFLGAVAGAAAGAAWPRGSAAEDKGGAKGAKLPELPPGIKITLQVPA